MDSSSGSGSTALRRQSTSTTATTMTTRRRRGTTALKMHTRGMFATAVVCLLALVVVVAPVLVKAAPYEPPGNQVLFGVWIDPADGEFVMSPPSRQSLALQPNALAKENGRAITNRFAHGPRRRRRRRRRLVRQTRLRPKARAVSCTPLERVRAVPSHVNSPRVRRLTRAPLRCAHHRVRRLQ